MLKRLRQLGLPVGVTTAIVLLTVIVLAALLAPLLGLADPARQVLIQRLKPPGTATSAITYWLGTDDLGRDLLSRIIYGARASLVVAASSVAGSLLVGCLAGMLAGYRRGIVGTVLMRVVDIMLSVPAVLFAVLTVAVLGPSFLNLILVLCLTRWPRYTRVAYGQTLQVATLPYVRAAEIGGAGTGRILLLHILPNIAGPMTVVATSEFGLMILFEAGLSFLGLGIQSPTPSWGSILSAGRQYVERAWWLTLFPGGLLFLLVFSVNVLGDWLRDRLDPQFRIR